MTAPKRSKRPRIDIGEGVAIGADVWAFGRAVFDAARKARADGVTTADEAEAIVVDVVLPRVRGLVRRVFDALED